MPRIFIHDSLEINKEIKIIDKIFHYLINVMRCKESDEVILVNGKDGEFLSTIIFANNKYCIIKIIEKTREYQPQPFLGLIFAPIQKIDILIKSAVELGATNFLPIKTEYTNKTSLKLDKIEGNIIEAIEQCERLDIPTVNKINSIDKTLESINDDKSIILFCEERTAENQIINIIKNNSLYNKKIYALVGPEGGFSDNEKKLIRTFKNVVSVSLGNNILRAETAAIAVLSIIKSTIN